MRTPSANQGKRHRARILAFQTVYSWALNGNSLEDLLHFSWMKKEEDPEVLLFARLVVSGVLENREEIDKLIQGKLTGWTVERLDKVALAILRVGVYSLVFQKDIPAQVTINEAVETAKEFARPESFKFINAVMDGIHKTML